MASLSGAKRGDNDRFRINAAKREDWPGAEGAWGDGDHGGILYRMAGLRKRSPIFAGSSAWFERGFVTYSNEAKSQMIGVSEATLRDNGAVSEPVVVEMAIGALRAARADYAISVSGVAGPDGGSVEKPVGTVWFGVASVSGQGVTRRECFAGDREAVRRQATAYALNLLWQQFLQNT